MDQIRYAVSVWLEALSVGPRAQRRILEKGSRVICYHRWHNTAGRRSHRKKTVEELRESGIDLLKIRTCAGSNFAL